jgi:hypothetical protein
MTKFQSIQNEAVGLSREDRSALATVLLSTLGRPQYDVSDDEVRRRDEEMDSGKDKGLSHSELAASVRRKTR